MAPPYPDIMADHNSFNNNPSRNMFQSFSVIIPSPSGDGVRIGEVRNLLVELIFQSL